MKFGVDRKRISRNYRRPYIVRIDMVKMAYAPLPKLVPINASNMCPNNMAKIALSEVSYIVIVQIEKKMNKKVYYII